MQTSHELLETLVGKQAETYDDAKRIVHTILTYSKGMLKNASPVQDYLYELCQKFRIPIISFYEDEFVTGGSDKLTVMFVEEFIKIYPNVSIRAQRCSNYMWMVC
jgi:hypothetical protein